MKIVFRIYNWGCKKERELEENIEEGKDYVISNNFGKFIAFVEKVEKKIAKKDSELCISEEKTECPAFCKEDYFKIIRLAEEKDLAAAKELRKEEISILEKSRLKVKEHNLPMKLVGANISLDGGSVVVAFTAENKVDFRDLVRDLARTVQKAVRLEQIGSRDEARINGGYGPCGRELCCLKFGGALKSINTEMAKMQQITHRGSERISGCCGRLICCLSYELENYEEILKKMPQAGDPVRTRDGEGMVRNIKVLQKKVLVEFGDKKREEKWFDLSEIKIQEK
jgi:cell fate regulator YaaT (PSP1 superfamily)